MRLHITFITALILLSFGLLACDTDEETPSHETAILLGEGITLDGVAVSVGSSRVELDSALGAALVLRDLGPLGIRFSSAEHDISGLISSDDTSGVLQSVAVSGAFAGRTPEDIGLGSSSADVQSAYGAAEVDPFTQTWWYRDLGLAITLDAGVVIRLQVFQASL